MNKAILRACAAIIVVASLPTAVLAQAALPGSEVLTLSDAEKAEVLRHRDAADAGALPPLDALAARPSRQIHGEVGAMIGSNGTRGAYGSAAIPLGQTGEAAVSFESSRYGWSR